jgi:hypothetical protein
MSLIGNKDKDMKCITSLVLLLVASVSMAQGVPNTFTAGDPALAAEVNENFTDLDTRLAATDSAQAGLVDDIVITETELVEGDYIAIAYCPANTVAISASCACGGDGVTINWSMLVLCASGDDGTGEQGGAAACDIDFSYDPNLAPPLAEVYVLCAEVINADGTTAAAAGTVAKSSSLAAPAGKPSLFQQRITAAQDRIVNRISLLSSKPH